LLQTAIATIKKDPYARFILLGDMIDAITRKNDRRHFEQNYAEWLWGKDDIIQLQVDRVIDYFKPIAKKCIGIICGNHEKAVLRHADQDAYGRIVRALAQAGNQHQNDLQFGTSGSLTLLFKRGDEHASHLPTTSLTIYCHHGYGGGKLKGGKALNLERELLQHQSDLVLMGHVHDFLLTTKTIIRPDGTQQHMFGCFIPSFYQSHLLDQESYAEEAGYFPSIHGTFPITFHPDKKRIIFHISNQP